MAFVGIFEVERLLTLIALVLFHGFVRELMGLEEEFRGSRKAALVTNEACKENHRRYETMGFFFVERQSVSLFGAECFSAWILSAYLVLKVTGHSGQTKGRGKPCF